MKQIIKHKRLNLIIILLVTTFVLWYLLKDHYQEIVESLMNANVFFIALALVLCFLYLLCDVLAFHFVTRIYSKNIKFGYQLYIGIISRFFSGITPLATGSQPMQVYELHKKGISVTHGTNIAIQSYMLFQMAVVVVGIIAIVINKAFNLFIDIPFLRIMTIVGFIINFGILFILLLVSFSKNFNRSIISGIIRFLSKMKLVKNKDKKIEKWNKNCDEYYENARMLLRNKKVVFLGVGFEIIGILAFYLIPFVLSYSLGVSDNLTWYASISAASYVFITGCYVPIPGATGGMEYGFSGIFGNFIIGYKLNALLVIWRFITYYLPLLIGGVVFNIKNHLKDK